MSESIVVAIITALGGIISAVITVLSNKGTTETKVSTGPSHQIKFKWYIILIGTLFSFLCGILLAKSITQAISKFTAQSIPLSEFRQFSFENYTDLTDVRPWISVPPSSNPPILSISSEEAHSGKYSLRLKMNVKILDLANPNEYGGIGITGNTYPDLISKTILASVAWVFLPKSEQLSNSTLYGHLFGYIHNTNGEYLAIHGADTELTPGEWTSVFWGASYQIQILPNLSFVSSDKRTSELYITFWSTQPYNGSIYIDDITLFTHQE